MESKVSSIPLPKTSHPADRALAAIGITTLDQLHGKSEKEIAKLHGVGPKAVRIWKAALEANGLAFTE
jgi:transposase